MAAQEQVYRDLQKHLNNQPIGFPSTKSGSDLRLLKRFFDPNEALLAMKLSYKPKPLKDIYDDAKKTGISFDDLKNTLNGMADKGVIGEGERNGVQCFFNIPLIVGMCEGQLYGLTRELLKV